MNSIARIVVFATMGLSACHGVQAQVIRFSPGVSEGARSLPEDREVLLQLRRAEDELAAGSYAEAIDRLQLILDYSEDFLVDVDGGVSAREHVSRLLSDLPADGLRLYEQKFGQQATALAQAASAQQDLSLTAEVIRRFFHTAAGGEAAWQFAKSQEDRGHLVTAARWFDRLRLEHGLSRQWEPQATESSILCWWRAGRSEASAIRLLELFRWQASPQLRGQNVPSLTNVEDARVWLAANFGDAQAAGERPVRDWEVAGGNPQRDASIWSGTPIWDGAWQRPVVDRSEVASAEQYEEFLTELESLQHRGSSAPHRADIPVHAPVVTGDTLVFGAYGYVSGVEAATGRLIWKTYEPDDTFSYLVKSLTSAGSVTGLNQHLAGPFGTFLQQRAWRDQTSAALSTDGEHVFVIKDSGLVGALSQSVLSAQIGRHPLRADSHNQLRAYEAEGGRLTWEAGGPRDRVSLPLAGTFFLGAPLPVNGRLYVLGEDSGQIRLLAIDPQTGELEWSLALVNAGASVNDALRRRLGGLSPAYAVDGDLLICPTGCGVVLAVELSTRTLAWAAEYRSNETEIPFLYDAPRPMVMGGRLVETVSPEMLLSEERWAGVAVQIAGDDVLLTAPDSDALHCLDLEDGQTVWSVPREDSLYVAGCCRRTVAVVGRHSVVGLNRENGTGAWSCEIPEPSGIGIRSADRYHVPLVTAEVATIDLAAGRLLVRSPTRSGQVLGNLVAGGGRLFTQTPSTLMAFRDVREIAQQVASDLQQNPADAAALAVRGEMALHAGEATRGLADLRASLAEQRHPRVEQLVVSTLLEGLRVDFAGYQGAIDEIDRLAQTPAQRMVFLRTVAEGLEETGQPLAAFDRYLELALMPTEPLVPALVAPGHRVRADRWTAGRLRRLSERMQEQHPGEFGQRLDDVMAGVLEQHEAQSIDRMLALFSSHREADRLRRALVTGMTNEDSALLAESLLLTLRQSSDVEVPGEATARLAKLYAEQGSSELAAALLGEVETRWADVECLPGRTGRDLGRDWRESSELGPGFADVPNWPAEQIQVKTRRHSSNANRNPVPFNGPVDRQWCGWSFWLEGDKLVACDGYGRRQWAHPLGQLDLSSFSTTQYVAVRGHLVLVFLGDRFLLLDTLQPGAPRTIRETLLMESVGESTSPWRSRRIVQTQHPGFRVHHRQDLVTRHFVGNVGPLCERQFCFLTGDMLHAIDPVTGEELWTRSGIEHGSEILADDEYIVLCPPAANAHRVRRLHALDGSDAGPPLTLPDGVQTERKSADWGRMFLTIRKEGEAYALGLYDPIREEQVWEREIDEEFHWTPVDGQQIAVLDGQGWFEIIQTKSGDTVLRVKVDDARSLESVSVLSTPDRWYLLTQRPLQQLALGRLVLPKVRYQLLPVNGPVCAINRDSQQVDWQRQVTNQAIDPHLPGAGRCSCSMRRFGEHSGPVRVSLPLTITTSRLRFSIVAMATCSTSRTCPTSGAGSTAPQ